MKLAGRRGLVSLGLLAGCLVAANWPAPPLPQEARADRVIIRKSRRQLELWQAGTVLRRYPVRLGRHPVGHKEREGDARTPEGLYEIDYRNPQSGYHLALHISYPRPEDVARARELGVSPGGDIMIHGIRNGLGCIGRLHRARDWTQGCVAMTNPEIEEVWRVVPDGTPVEITP